MTTLAVILTSTSRAIESAAKRCSLRYRCVRAHSSSIAQRAEAPAQPLSSASKPEAARKTSASDTQPLRTSARAQAVIKMAAAAAKAAPKLVVRTFNKINAAGLSRFDPSMFQIKEDNNDGAHAILLRSHKLQAGDVPLMCRSIARCGAGTNNCNVPLMSELGVPVFNTPGANANAVKELVLCGLLMASRGIYEGAAHMVQLHKDGTAHERIEKDKAMFGADSASVSELFRASSCVDGVVMIVGKSTRLVSERRRFRDAVVPRRASPQRRCCRRTWLLGVSRCGPSTRR